MYAVTHFSVGLMLGQAVGNPYAACALGLASHIVLDAIPHSDYSRIVHGVLDFAAVVAIACISIRAGAGRCALFGGLAAAIPDLEVAVAYLRMERDRSPCKHEFLFPSHNGLIRHGRLRPPWGVCTQIATVVVVWTLLRSALV
ncbi:MAG: hypothetical protein GX338_03855 [Firmicutes bacterium]|jgi:hypothetical protein|nr:hypothetical protein [Bacillota bacterium]